MKKIFSLMIAIVAMFTMNAQAFESSRFIDNTYFRIEGGATALTHPDCKKYYDWGYENWGHTIQGVIGAEVGKWVTPKFGVAFEGDFGIRNGSDAGKFNYFYGQYDKMGLFKGTDDAKANRFNYITVTGLVKFNVSNILAGWNPNRKFEFVLATGPMWIHGFPSNIHHKNDGSEYHGDHYYVNDIGVKFKAEINYNLTERWQLNLIPEFNYNLTGADESDGEHFKFNAHNSWYAIKAGVTYKMGNQFTECPYKYTQEDVDALNEQINELRARKPEVIEKEVIKKVVKKEYIGLDEVIITFEKESSELTDIAKAVLNKIIEYSTVVTYIQGDASYDGNAKFNENLANARAESVKKYLEDNGVKVINADGKMTGSRIATIYVK